jgi:hypothetical protein
MILFHEVDYEIWSNFHVDHVDWIAKNFELKLKNSPGL